MHRPCAVTQHYPWREFVPLYRLTVPAINLQPVIAPMMTHNEAE